MCINGADISGLLLIILMNTILYIRLDSNIHKLRYCSELYKISNRTTKYLNVH